MADWGLRLWNEAGNITLDISNDTGRLGGLRSVPAGNGTIAFQVAPGKTPYFYPVQSSSANYTWSYSGGTFTFWMQSAGYVFFGES